MLENESSEWIHDQWESIDARVESLSKKIDDSIARAEQLLVDIEFLRMMLEEDLI
jgi:hypothetical protein